MEPEGSLSCSENGAGSSEIVSGSPKGERLVVRPRILWEVRAFAFIGECWSVWSTWFSAGCSVDRTIPFLWGMFCQAVVQIPSVPRLCLRICSKCLNLFASASRINPVWAYNQSCIKIYFCVTSRLLVRCLLQVNLYVFPSTLNREMRT